MTESAWHSYYLVDNSTSQYNMATGCGSDNNGMNRDEQFNQLMQRPSLEEVFEQYQRMRKEIADELTSKIGLPAWTQDDSDGGGSLFDKAGHHLVDFKDSWGGRLSMGTMVHSNLLVRTGCHLTSEAKQRGTPTPLPEQGR